MVLVYTIFVFYATIHTMIDKELLDILACPACKGDVEQQDVYIVCLTCSARYPIKDGVPVMIAESEL